MAKTNRKEDSEDKRYFRASERLFRMNEAWFFAAREGDQGPYPDEREAVVEMRRYIEAQVELANFEKGRAEARNNVLELELLPQDRPTMRKHQPVRAQRRVMI